MAQPSCEQVPAVTRTQLVGVENADQPMSLPSRHLQSELYGVQSSHYRSPQYQLQQQRDGAPCQQGSRQYLPNTFPEHSGANLLQALAAMPFFPAELDRRLKEGHDSRVQLGRGKGWLRRTQERWFAAGKGRWHRERPPERGKVISVLAFVLH